MRFMDDTFKRKLALAIKNKQDIADLLVGYSIKGVDLTGAIISHLNMNDQDISECNLTRCVIGTKDTEINFNRVTATNVSFVGTTFPGKVLCRRAVFTRCNFTGCYFPWADYRFAFFDDCCFCSSVFSIATPDGVGAKFSKNFFADLSKLWGIKILTNEEYDELRSKVCQH